MGEEQLQPIGEDWKRQIPESALPKENPDSFGAALTELHNYKRSLIKQYQGNRVTRRHDGALIINNVNGFKDNNDGIINGRFTELAMRLADFGVYNGLRPELNFDPLDQVDLVEERGASIREIVRKGLRELSERNLIRVITPFKREAATVRGVIEYNADLVGAENVLAVEAGSYENEQHLTAIRSVLNNKDVRLVSQTNILQGINWRALTEAGIIFPPNLIQDKNESDEAFRQRYEKTLDTPPVGSKGLTMLAGILDLHARDVIARQVRDRGEEYDPHDILDADTYIVFHDTDVKNPTEYAGTEYLVFGMMLTPDGHTHRSFQIARTGFGRNNEPVIEAYNRMVRSENEIESKLGESLQSLIWPLSGERAIRWGDLKKSLWANGMGVETTLNASFAAMDIEEGYRGIAQVGDPEQKNEGEGSADSREFGMIFDLAKLQTNIGQFAGEINKLPHQWNVDDIAEFNSRHGGLPSFDAVPVHSRNGHVSYAAMETNYILPSLERLVEMGAIDYNHIVGLNHQYDSEGRLIA